MKKDIIRFLWKYLKNYKMQYLIGGLFIIIASLLGVLSGYLNGISVEK